ncbi:MAG: amino acid permease [Burkholderiales bacterium]|jgi:L-asparagine transporter-like permease|nr:amino acid permease [Burkholderiales bacterium]
MTEQKKLQHPLKNRHIQMIALGGVIGTGLFFGAAKSIQSTGPSIILSYILGGLVIYIIMRALGEMTVHHPSSGSFSDYANRYINNYTGFIAGWTAWFEYTVVCMVELTAVTFFLDYWIPGLPHWLVCLGLLLMFTMVQLISVRLFGEFEFWFAGIKIAAIILMLLFSAYLVTFNPQVHAGTINNLHSYASLDVFFASGAKGFLFSLAIVIFSFGGTEFVSIAAGEAENPRKSIPQAISGVIIRIILFYILTILAIICLYPFNKLNANVSPFVDVFKEIGINQAATVMNAVAITAALSAFNSCMYAASRILFSLAKQGSAPAKLAILNNINIPSKALLFTSFCILISVIVNYIFPEKAIMYLLTIATCAILTCWFLILLTQIYFRKKIALDKISYRLILYPASNIFAMCFLIMVMFIMLWIDDMRASVIVTPIWIFALSIFYAFNKKIKSKTNG